LPAAHNAQWPHVPACSRAPTLPCRGGLVTTRHLAPALPVTASNLPPGVHMRRHHSLIYSLCSHTKRSFYFLPHGRASALPLIAPDAATVKDPPQSRSGHHSMCTLKPSQAGPVPESSSPQEFTEARSPPPSSSLLSASLMLAASGPHSTAMTSTSP
jgi:hypothetical protein